MRLTRENLDKLTIPTRRIPVPEYSDDPDAFVDVQAVNPLVLRKASELYPDKDQNVEQSAYVFVYTAVDEAGKLLFTEADIPTFVTKAPNLVLRASGASIDLCQYNVEASKKNLPKTQSSP